jgi:hypothetical protein
MAEGAPAPGAPSRAERDEARRRRAEGAQTRRSYARGRPSVDDRPPAPWGNFPLSELTIFIGIVMIIAGFFVSGSRGPLVSLAGLVLGSLGGLEISIREHFAGYRSHSLLLAGALGVLTITVVALVAGKVLVPILLGAGLVAFAAGFVVLREAFKRRSGGVSFR